MIQKSPSRNSLSLQPAKITGKIGEDLALKFLARKGFRLVNKNYHIRGGEIDLILENDDILLFVEVKTRQSTKFGEPVLALNQKKIRTLLRAILHYLSQNPKKFNWRCDLVAIQFTSSGTAQIKHIKNIFDH